MRIIALLLSVVILLSSFARCENSDGVPTRVETESGKWPGVPTESTEFPAIYYVDYVIVYQ